MTRCPKCGAEVKYIPVGYSLEASGVAIVEPGYAEIINDNGRVIKGHVRHQCPEIGRGNPESYGRSGLRK